MEHTIDLLAAEMFRDPYPVYAQLRAETPVFWSEQLQSWVVTRYDDVFALLRDPRLNTGWPQLPLARGLTPEEQADLRALERLRNNMLGSLNGAEHARQRALVNSAFTARAIEQLRAAMQAHTDTLIDAVAGRGQIDLIKDLAVLLPLEVFYQLMGVPPEFQDTIKAGTDAVAFSSSLYDPAPGQLREMWQAAYAGEQCLRTLIAERRAHPREDLLSRLVHASQEGQQLSDDELCVLVYTLLMGSFETMASLMGSGMLSLLRHPDQLNRLLAEPALVETAVEELLRFEAPVRVTLRIPNEDIQMRGVTIHAGQLVLLMLGAANRDPAQFPEPDRLDLARTPNRHLSFGYGAHFCIGAALARLQGQIAFNTLLRRLPGLRLAVAPNDVAWQPSTIMRTLKALPLVFDPAV